MPIYNLQIYKQEMPKFFGACEYLITIIKKNPIGSEF